MALYDFIKSHINDINNYTQPAIQWRTGRFAAPVAKAESVGGDFAIVMTSLPTALTRNDVVACFREDLYNGFVAAIVWGGISRYQAEEISRRNDRQSSLPKLERLRQMLQDSDEDATLIDDAVASMRRGKENYFYGIGPSFFTKLLYFLSFDLDLVIRPLIYDENLKPVHFALMAECNENPFYYYVPVGDKIQFAQFTSFEDVYIPYCSTLCGIARKLDIDVTNLESWLFGWPVNIKKPQPNPREVARIEVERMAATGFIQFQCKIEDLYDAISVSRILYDNGFVDTLPDSRTSIGQDQDHPIVITETDNYVHLEYAVAEALFNLKGLSFKLDGQSFYVSNDRYYDKLVFKVWSGNSGQKDLVLYFDITEGYKAI